MYHARPPRWVVPFFAPIFIADIREQEINLYTFLTIAIVLLILGLSYQLKVDQTIHFHVCFFQFKVIEKSVPPADIHTIVFRDAGWGTPSASIKMKKGFPIRVVNFDSVEVLADFEDFAERYQIRREERKYYRTVYDMKKSKEKQGAS
ncbi:hypothetical protein GLV98_02670 [Halobacillus litoralis]|uniref:Uncharacterized protein n=1 Tax=Halobacillus litoralis TaxID=45668 RepID=A0A845DYK4_9BACI|nr:hypothetical protein [Halobacillus litoralis]MYL48364.1 hypothetical protein [Halobacillus litoralis]